MSRLSPFRILDTSVVAEHQSFEFPGESGTHNFRHPKSNSRLGASRLDEALTLVERLIVFSHPVCILPRELPSAHERTRH